MFKKVPLAKKNIRKRPNLDEDQDQEKNQNLVSTSTTNTTTASIVHKRVKNEPTLAELTKLVAHSKPTSNATQELEPLKVVYASTGTELTGPKDLGATRTNEYEQEETEDLSSLSEKEKNKPKFQRLGPQRAPAYLRVTSRMDYQPDVCKDYKETGFCGYGDSCKFLHDRGDYKLGWEIEQEWNQQQRLKKKKTDAWLDSTQFEGEDVQEENEEEEDDFEKQVDWIQEEEIEEEDTLPFACYLCRNAFESPIMTKCEHYFCETCILRHYKSHPKCPVCNTPTMGIFKPAKLLLQKLKERQLRIEAKEKAIREANLHLEKD